MYKYTKVNADIFNKTLLPGNYALTKSMEPTKIKNSGTLWYVKKFLVWYNYIILSDINKIMTEEYIDEVTMIFENYISSIKDENVRKSAQDYFFPKEDLINLKSNKFKKFSSFLGSFPKTINEKFKKESEARKYYFVFLMNIGGQSNDKKKLKEFIYDDNFSMDKLDYYVEKIIKDKSKKSIINKKEKQLLKSDYHASLRNERQLLYYYGYFHSKSNGNCDEFSSLTPVGELALTANHDEFICIYEMQKIKMISQPIGVTVDNLDKVPINYRTNNFFKISYSPYLDILNHLDFYKKINKDEYKFAISRLNGLSKRSFDENYVIMDKDVFDKKNLQQINSKIMTMNRKRDFENEDFDKELKKYILGIRSDLKFDRDSNVLSLVKCKKVKGEKENIYITSNENFNNTIRIYKYLNDYKLFKYKDLFDECENELNRQYNELLYNKIDLNNTDIKIKNKWNLFNIGIEEYILLGVMLNYYLIKNKLNLDFNLYNYIDDFREQFKNILSRLSFNNKKNNNTNLILKLNDLINNIKYNIMPEKEELDYSYDFKKINNISNNDLKKKIKLESEKKSNLYLSERTRNTSLINSIRNLYNTAFLKDNLLTCECCGETTFLTEKGIPYIEFHHIIPFGIANGPEHYLNIYGLCPNCHRKFHFSKHSAKRFLYENINIHNHYKIPLLERLYKMDDCGCLKSYHWEFLLAEDAISKDEFEQALTKNRKDFD